MGLKQGSKLSRKKSTVWKFQDFSITHILREINLEVVKLPFLPFLGI